MMDEELQTRGTKPTIFPDEIYRKQYAKAALTGEFTPPSDEDIDAFVESVWEKPALTPLSSSDSEFLKNYFRWYTHFFPSAPGRRIQHPAVYDSAGKYRDSSWSAPFLYTGKQAQKVIDQHPDAEVLSPEELLNTITDPMSTSVIEVVNGISIGKIDGEGINRPLFITDKYPNDNYGFTTESMAELLQIIASATDSADFNVFDIGMGNGYGLWDLTEHQHAFQVTTSEGNNQPVTFHTSGVTLREFPAYWPVDQIYITPAEMLPENLRQTQDLVISHFAFTYLAYPDVAMKNVQKMLKTGGVAQLWFNYTKSALNHGYPIDPPYEGPSIEERVTDTFHDLVAMHKSGIIKITEAPFDPDDYDPDVDIERPLAGRITFQKLLPIPDDSTSD